LDTIVATARRLCKAERAMIWRLQGDTFRTVAHLGLPTERIEAALKQRLPVGRGSVVGRAAAARRAIQVEDVVADPELAAQRDYNRAGNTPTVLAVPLLLKGNSIGVITLSRTRVARFDDKQVALVESFADQAVIAIENSRLFEAEQASKRELQESLEHQTATSEVLNVISRSTTDTQPVFAAIAESSVRLCGADYGSLVRLEGCVRHRVADHGMTPKWSEVANRIFPQELTRGLIGDAAMLDRTIKHVENIQNDDGLEISQALARTMGYRTALAVPMLRESGPVGAIVVFRQEERRFSEAEIGLLRTFADQAVIAIENTRLFEEVQARNRDLTALREVGRAAARSAALWNGARLWRAGLVCNRIFSVSGDLVSVIECAPSVT
jgi:GAF domain-containing protein